MKKATATHYAKIIRPIYKSHKITVRRLPILEGFEIHISEGDGYETRLTCEESAEDYIRIHKGGC